MKSPGISHRLAAVLLLWLAAIGAQVDAGAVALEPGIEEGETDSGAASVRVFFATNRARERGGEGLLYGGVRGESEFGSCTVVFKPIPLMSEVAQKVPFFLPTETNDFSIRAESDSERFWDQITAAVESTSSGAVAVFIHGYSYDFERACGRAAEAQRILQGEVTVLMFTWPSNGRLTDYVSDQADLEWSVPLLEQVLEELTDRFGPAAVHVLAHSLGSRGIIAALERLKTVREDRPLIGRLVLIAPDFDSQVFVELLPRLAPLTDGITLYASSHDMPLKFSQQLNGSPRLGQAGEFLTVIEGVETVDVSPAGRYEILGHEYFYFHPVVVHDLVELLTTGKGAAQRSALRTRWLDDRKYWEVIEATEK